MIQIHNISYDYKTNMYDENYINSMHKRILHIISQVTSTPNMLISQIDIVTPYEKKSKYYSILTILKHSTLKIKLLQNCLKNK